MRELPDAVAPSTPTGLTGAPTSATTVNLSWTASTDNRAVTGYDVLRNGAVIGTVSGTTTTYTDSTAGPATTYQYTVDANDEATNVSPASAPVSVTTPAGSAMPALVQSAGSTAQSVTLPAASVAGHLLVLSAGVYTGATNNITSVTDSAGNTWTKVGAYSSSGHNSDGEMWYAANAAPTTTITVHTATVVSTALEVQEFSGVAATGPLDVKAGTASTSTTPDSGSVTPTGSNALVVGFVAGHANTEAITPSGAGFTSLTQQTTPSPVVSVVSGYKVLGSPSAVSYSGTFGAAMYWAAGVVTFKSA